MTISFRPGTSDVDALQEVLLGRAYARPGFDVEPGETWLDLGANIGSFAIYAHLRGAAMVECYEPDPDCFALLRQNVPASFLLHQAAVTNQRTPTVPFKKSANPDNHWRGTVVDAPGLVDHPAGSLPNVYGGDVRDRVYDGVKMDIEGAEAGLIDDDLLPRCRKLVLEFHFSRLGDELRPFFRRLKRLRRLFWRVEYPHGIDSDFTRVPLYCGDHDPLVFCWNPVA